MNDCVISSRAKLILGEERVNRLLSEVKLLDFKNTTKGIHFYLREQFGGLLVIAVSNGDWIVAYENELQIH